MTLREQDVIWSRQRKPVDVLICLGENPGDPPPKIPSIPCIIDQRYLYDADQNAVNGADRLLASLFYIELLAVPQLADIGFRCTGHIRCRLRSDTEAYQMLVTRLQKTKAHFYYAGQVVPCITNQIYNQMREGVSFSKYFELETPSLDTVLDIRIDGITKSIMSISNCPYILNTLIADQKLNCVFGSSERRRAYTGILMGNSNPYIIE
ncbi:hypothetical protein B0O99DRAFT_399361 [Bisporella sp. PMI_857]|nr:hypothetical protein B0O99DRAFT_399361 [Bisporella sp. PMI_857]